MEINNANSDTYSLIILIICVLITLIFTLKNSSKPSDSGLEQRINGSVKMFSDIISENQQVIGNMQTNRFAQMDNEIKSMRQSMENTLPICTKVSPIYPHFHQV